MLAIAELAGGEWKRAAWQAAMAIEQVRSTFDTSPGVELLANIQAVFCEARNPSRLATANLLGERNENAEWTWAT